MGNERKLTQQSEPDFEYGQRVTALDNTGYVRFKGITKFAPGNWVGVEFDRAVGNIDGSVEGVRYFRCEAYRGMFLRPEQVKLARSVPRESQMPCVRDSPPLASYRGSAESANATQK